MQILSDNINYNNTFKSLYIPDPKLQLRIWGNANKKQKIMLNNLWNQELLHLISITHSSEDQSITFSFFKQIKRTTSLGIMKILQKDEHRKKHNKKQKLQNLLIEMR